MNEQAKTIVFSFDGTDNEPEDAEKADRDQNVSNVLKLHILLGGGFKSDGTTTTTESGREQKTFYYNGVGTYESELHRVPLLGWGVTKFKKVINRFFAPKGGDAKQILECARQDFNTEYRPGDTLVMLGFSRGAALARKFAAELLKEGVCDSVAFLGVYDTVAALGDVQFPWEHTSSDVVFENGTLHPGIKRAVHLVSLDEQRTAYRPTLINYDADKPDRILEVWFPGVHSDVGGGYWWDGLSDHSLLFMIEQCEKALGDDIRIHPPNKDEEIRELVDKQRELAEAGVGVDNVTVLPRVDGPPHSEFLPLYKKRRDVCVKEDDSKLEGERPRVHWSVKARFHAVPSYRPPALRDVCFTLVRANGDWEDMQGISGLRAAEVGEAEEGNGYAVEAEEDKA